MLWSWLTKWLPFETLQKDKSVAGVAALRHGSGGPFVLPKCPPITWAVSMCPKILSLSAVRHHLPTLAARSRQRVIRIAVLFAALHESAFGLLADILFMAVYVRFR